MTAASGPPRHPTRTGQLWRPWLLLVAAGLLLSVLGLGCGADRASSSPAAGPVATASRPPEGTADRPATTAPLTPRQALRMAGEHVIYSYAGERPPASLLRVIRAGEAAGVILFGPNVANRTALAAAIGAMQAAAHASPAHRRLLILTDQEGGLVRRLPGAPTLSERQIGERADAGPLATRAGAGAAANLRTAGINVNLAPVLDVYRSPGDFIDQYGRSYSNRAAVVGALAARFIAAQQRAGVAATAKHFPGLGSATQPENTDAVPVRLPLGLSELRRVDEAPYRAAIAAGVKLVMVSWATYPALDRTRPAGLSARVIEGELRQRLHFSGVTITDGIEAGALAHEGGVANRSVAATAAGADLILACGTSPSTTSPTIGLVALHAIATALLRGHLNLGAAQRSTVRVLKLRASL